jgi:hypothetical protein
MQLAEKLDWKGLKGHLFKLGQEESIRCDRCKQAPKMPSYVLCAVMH